jgi:hypothetical protein
MPKPAITTLKLTLGLPREGVPPLPPGEGARG